MTQTATAALPLAADVKEQLVERWGDNCIWQVQRLGKHTFKAWTRNNKTLLVTVRADGALDIKEQEGHV